MNDTDLERLTAMRRLLKTGTAVQLRQGADLSRSEVAAMLQVSREALQKWELGDRTPRGRPALRYARLLERLQRTDRDAVSS